jgi:hypothetical protein
MCSSRVEYKDRQGPCQRAGKYPDPDGTRWWCGLHNPDRRAKARPAGDDGSSESLIDKDVLIGIKDGDVAEAIQAMDEAHQALVEIANTSVSNWSPNTPVEKYQIIMAHMADQAKAAGAKLAYVISQLKT